MKPTILPAVLLVTLIGSAAMAAERTVTFPVAFTCTRSEPPAVEMVLTRIDGVEAVDIAIEEAQVRVVYDDAHTGIDAMMDALDMVGLGGIVQQVPDAPD